MALSYDQAPGAELKWDIPALIRLGGINASNCFSFTKKLAPTAVNGAVWGLITSGTSVPFVWGIFFSSDTAIEWTLYNVNGGTSLTAANAALLGQGGGPDVSTGAQIGTIPAVRQLYDGGFAAANDRKNLLGQGWISCPTASGIVLATSAVAANCYATFYWVEFHG